MSLDTLVAAAVGGWSAAHGPGLVVGLSGPQGCGKSTAARAAGQRLEAQGLRVAVLGLDDLYLSRAERQHLAREVHPLFATRGPPGTHDVALGLQLIDGLCAHGVTLLPTFDKSVDERAATWTRFEGPADVVLFEGWCVGVRPQPASELAAPVNVLERDEDPDGRWRAAVNAALAAGGEQLWRRLDRLIVLTAPDWPTVVRWRTETERDNGAMDAAQIARFLQHYQRLTCWAAADLPARADLHIPLDAERRGRG